MPRLQAYLDESGHSGDSPICAIAGYFGGVNQWAKFERSWKRILEREAVAEFHAKRFWARDNDGNLVSEYKGWTKDRARRFLADLLEVIRANRVYPIAGVLVMEEWRRLTKEERRWLTGAVLRKIGEKSKLITEGAPNKPYFLPFHHCVIKAALYCKPGIRVHFTLDANKNIEGWAVKLFQALKEKLCPRQLGDLVFADSRDACPLQAADLLAYEINRYAKSRTSGQRPKPRVVLMRALSSLRDMRDLALFGKQEVNFSLRYFRGNYPV